jgi:hypothetical protein
MRETKFTAMGVSECEAIQADYSISVKALYRDTARYFIHRDRNLDILSACKHFDYDAFLGWQYQASLDWLKDGFTFRQWQFDQLNAMISRHAETIAILVSQLERISPHGYSNLGPGLEQKQ